MRKEKTHRMHEFLDENDSGTKSQYILNDVILKYPAKLILGHAVAWWLRNYAINRKVTGSILDEMNF
jgi:hypothetical protein